MRVPTALVGVLLACGAGLAQANSFACDPPTREREGVCTFRNDFEDRLFPEELGLNSVPHGFSVIDGTVDLIGRDGNQTLYDLLPGNGIYVDLDGSTNRAGTLSITFALPVDIGFVLGWELAGSQRGTTEKVNVSLFLGDQMTHPVYGETFELRSDQTFMQMGGVSVPAREAGDTKFTLAFHNEGGDNIGALLGSLTSTLIFPPIPEPSTYALMLIAGVCIGTVARRRRVIYS